MNNQSAANTASVGVQRPFGAATVIPLVLLAGITALAAWLRLHAIDAKSLWMDEGVTAAYMRLDCYNLVRLLWRREANMTFYFILLRGWLHFGQSVAWYRGLSALAAVANVPVVYALGKRLFSPAVGLTGALLLAVNAYHVRYAQEARSYSWVALLVTFAAYFFVRAVETGRRRDWNWYVATIVLSVCTHFFGVLVVAAHWVALQVLPSRRGTGSVGDAAPAGTLDWPAAQRGMMRAIKLIGWWTLPVWFFIAKTGRGVIRWITRPGLHDFYAFVQQFSGNAGSRLAWLYVASVALAWLAAMRAWRRGHPETTWPYAMLLAWLIVPLLITLAVTLAIPVFLPRYLIISLPALSLLAAAGLLSFPWKWPALPVVALMVGIAIGGLQAYYTRDFDIDRQDYRRFTGYLLQHSQPGDAILFFPGYGRCAYQYYADHYPEAKSEPFIVAPGHGDRMTWRDFMGKVPPQVLDRVTVDYGRVWVLLSNTPGSQGEAQTTQQIQTAIQRRYRLAEISEFPGLKLLLYTP